MMMKEDLKCHLISVAREIGHKNPTVVSKPSREKSLKEGKTLKIQQLVKSTAVNLIAENKNWGRNVTKWSANEHLSVQCEFCGKRYINYERLKDHFRFCHPKVYHKCSICSLQFSKKWLLNSHMRKHNGESPYCCLYCNQKFMTNNKLQIHLNFYHKEKNLCCEFCNALGFYTKQDLGNHIRTKHTKERVFNCDICNKSFMSSNVYYQHRFVHTNIKKYSCTVCSKAFKRSLTLHNHLKIHTDERPFSCGVCRQAFRQKGDMKKHKLNQHSNIKM